MNMKKICLTSRFALSRNTNQNFSSTQAKLTGFVWLSDFDRIPEKVGLSAGTSSWEPETRDMRTIFQLNILVQIQKSSHSSENQNDAAAIAVFEVSGSKSIELSSTRTNFLRELNLPLLTLLRGAVPSTDPATLAEILFSERLWTVASCGFLLCSVSARLYVSWWLRFSSKESRVSSATAPFSSDLLFSFLSVFLDFHWPGSLYLAPRLPSFWIVSSPFCFFSDARWFLFLLSLLFLTLNPLCSVSSSVTVTASTSGKPDCVFCSDVFGKLPCEEDTVFRPGMFLLQLFLFCLDTPEVECPSPNQRTNS